MPTAGTLDFSVVALPIEVGLVIWFPPIEAG